MCWDVPESGKNAPVLTYDCHGGGGNQEWKYDVVSKRESIGNYQSVIIRWKLSSG